MTPRVLSKEEFIRLSTEERAQYLRAVTAATRARGDELRALIELHKVLLENVKERRKR